MDTLSFIKGEHSDPTVFNNPEDSDIILQCGDRQIYAHRAFLRAWSPFFERSFKSQFSVAKSPIFVIDPEDSGDYEPLCSVLKHIYGMPLLEHSDNCFTGMEAKDYLGFYIKIYTLADKYDFPSVRIAVVDNLQGHAESGEFAESMRLSMADGISILCGPDAPQLADPALRDFLFDWVVESFDYMGDFPEYEAKLVDGSLLDADLATQLTFRLGQRIRELIKASRKRNT